MNGCQTGCAQFIQGGEKCAPGKCAMMDVSAGVPGTIYRVKDERGDWVADFAEKDQAERFCHTLGVSVPDGETK